MYCNPGRLVRCRSVTTEPPATVELAAGSLGIELVHKTGPRQDAVKKTAGNGQDGVAGVKWRRREPNKRGFTREITVSRPTATQHATHFRLIGSTCSPAQ